MVKTWTAPYFATLGRRPVADRDGPNAHIDRWARSRRNRFWREVVGEHLVAAGFPRALPKGGSGWRVTIAVTQARGPLPDTDNRHGMTKAIRDAIAAYIGVSDAPGGIEWDVDWQRGTDDTTIILEAIT